MTNLFGIIAPLLLPDINLKAQDVIDKVLGKPVILSLAAQDYKYLKDTKARSAIGLEQCRNNCSAAYPQPQLPLPQLPPELELPLLEFLKSVSYQPPPFKRKPEAEINFFNLDSLQTGQSFMGSSDIFCISSIS
jgi:hypothetical protein